jgi:uncharacterized membrane protein YedE/YeeE
MSAVITGLCIGALFGAALVLAALADPDKIIGTLRLKDFHAMRTIILFVLVGMLGTWILELAGVAHLDVKPAAIVSVFLGGALLGIGFGMTGFCPGTGLACAASGRLDALVTVIGMFAGALVFILIHPAIVVPIEKIANFGKITLPQLTSTPRAAWVLPISTVGFIILYMTRPKT